ncbi:hypothetical protein HID58_070775 [Brassica napus]|uniref:DUF577 domain-containing protein n=1 Tax=Brassica napus TaxID=3708 RepID=A0ABQ7YZR8_BRANA|nr:hypothetical protein HID58_070775 [Brassica napus]
MDKFGWSKVQKNEINVQDDMNLEDTRASERGNGLEQEERLEPKDELVSEGALITPVGPIWRELFLEIRSLMIMESISLDHHCMIDSVRELVERGMEVGLVRRDFGDSGTTVKKQLTWYHTSKYKFVKGLLWRLYEIKGMKMESKMVLWRIIAIVESGVSLIG